MKSPAPASLAAVRAASVAPAGYVHLPGGARLWTVDRPPEDGPARTPLVLLHGYLDSHYSFNRILPFLPRDRRILAPDLRGHGRSFRPASGCGMADLAADVLALLDVLGIPAAVLVGHSMGSFVAQQLAAAVPQRVEALVLIGSAPSIGAMNGLEELREAVGTLRDPVPYEFVRGFQESTIAGPVPSDFLDHVIAESLLVPAKTMGSLLGGMLATPALEEGRIAVPTLLLWGTEDAVFGRAAQERLLGSAWDVRLLEYPATGHASHWESPERLAADIRIFLADENGSSPGPRGSPAITRGSILEAEA